MNFNAIIEIPKNSFYKYEYNKDNNQLVLDRVLPVDCPFNYGFIDESPIQADGDQLDVFVISEYPIEPLTKVPIKVIGVLLCDDNGVEDNKVVARIKGDDCYGNYSAIHSIKTYLVTYKTGFKVKEYKLTENLDFK